MKNWEYMSISEKQAITTEFLELIRISKLYTLEEAVKIYYKTLQVARVYE